MRETQNISRRNQEKHTGLVVLSPEITPAGIGDSPTVATPALEVRPQSPLQEAAELLSVVVRESEHIDVTVVPSAAKTACEQTVQRTQSVLAEARRALDTKSTTFRDKLSEVQKAEGLPPSSPGSAYSKKAKRVLNPLRKEYRTQQNTENKPNANITTIPVTSPISPIVIHIWLR